MIVRGVVRWKPTCTCSGGVGDVGRHVECGGALILVTNIGGGETFIDHCARCLFVLWVGGGAV